MYGRSDITLNDWHSFNASILGRLQFGSPLSLPCFSLYEDRTVPIDSAACSAVQDNYLNATFRVEYPGAYMFTPWETCQRTSEQCLLDSGDPTDPLATAGQDCDQGSVSPYYIPVQGVSDVQAALAFSLATGIHLVVKNSGHDFKGRSSSRNSLALWTYNLNSIEYYTAFIPEECSKSYSAITTGAGATWQQVYEFAEEHNLTAIGGYAATIGASGGYLMGGGHSVLSPVFGLGVDHVVQFKIVTPDGIYRIANECQNTDLFWALRGGGGGTFGIVLESTQIVHPQITLQVAALSFNRSATNSQEFLDIVVNNSVKWGNEGWGGHITGTSLINVTPNLSLEEATTSMNVLTEFIQAQNGSMVVEELPSFYSFFSKYVLSAEAGVGVSSVLSSRLIPTALFQTPSGRSAIQSVLAKQLSNGGSPYIIVGTPYLYNYTENSTSVTPAWRNSLWHLAFHSGWEWNSTLAVKKAAFGQVHNMTSDLRSISPDSGAYFNEGDVYEVDYEESFWGPNYPALLAIKEKYDPHHLLDCWQCVGWKGPADPLYDCYLEI